MKFDHIYPTRPITIKIYYNDLFVLHFCSRSIEKDYFVESTYPSVYVL